MKTNYLLFAIAWGLLISILSLLPTNQFPKTSLPLHIDKVIHAFLYGIWCILFLAGQAKNKRTINSIIFIITSVSLYGFLIEVIQEYIIIYRTFDLLDALANTCGAILFSFGFLKIKSN